MPLPLRCCVPFGLLRWRWWSCLLLLPALLLLTLLLLMFLLLLLPEYLLLVSELLETRHLFLQPCLLLGRSFVPRGAGRGWAQLPTGACTGRKRIAPLQHGLHQARILALRSDPGAPHEPIVEPANRSAGALARGGRD